jgi:pyridoxine 5-phosphate synthase
VLAEIDKIRVAGAAARQLGMRFNAGHALNYFNVQPIAQPAWHPRAAHWARDHQSSDVRRLARGGPEMKRLLREAQALPPATPT